MCMKFHETGSNPDPLFLCVVIFQSGSFITFFKFLSFHFISGFKKGQMVTLRRTDQSFLQTERL
jgi:hypothetical protein